MRLRSLTRLVSGDDRPKQFCKLLDGESLLSKTRQRVERNVAAERTLFILLRSHECYYDQELSGVPDELRVIQPANRGTLPAVLYSLLRLSRLDPDAVVAFFPSDHHYAHEDRFRAGVDQAFREAEANPNAVILLGADPTFAATDYGWIEAAGPTGTSEGMPRVARFWEKPSHPVALELLGCGCVWNTFVMVGRARAFLNMIAAGAPECFDVFRALSDRRLDLSDSEESLAAEIYASIESADLSKDVLAAAPQRLGPQSLGVYRLGNVGWQRSGRSRAFAERGGSCRRQ